MSDIATEIASQSACWRVAADLVHAAQEALPRPGERVAAVGCGTSLFVSRAYAALRESSGHGETDAFAASEFPGRRRYDWVVAITRSGTTTEVLRLLGRLDPGSIETLLAERCLMHVGAGSWALVHSRRRELLEPLHRGDAFLTRLEGEWWAAR